MSSSASQLYSGDPSSSLFFLPGLTRDELPGNGPADPLRTDGVKEGGLTKWRKGQRCAP
jgi:hypothetical protein